MDINRIPDFYEIEVEKGDKDDSKVEFSFTDGKLSVYLKSFNARPKVVRLRWNLDVPEDARFLGDAWERGYGNFEMRGINAERAMPWYFAAKYKNQVDCIGVMTLPSSLVSFTVDSYGITAWCDVRCGTHGVELLGRSLLIAQFVSKSYNEGVMEALCDFCRILCPNPVLPKEPVYGGNNWYYAYGNSSYDEIIADCKLQAKLAEGLSNRPFMVIDDGWQVNSCKGPWLPNEKFGDMKKVADEFRKADVRPGIWVRFLCDERDEITPDMRINRGRGNKDYLDPSSPAVLSLIKNDIRRMIDDWGFELIKHDYSAFDFFGAWGVQRNAFYACGDFTLYLKDLTNAEIYKNFCKTIFDSADGKAYILGCNCVSHLTAGYCHINRTGDDTSGYSWDRTRRMGINALSFRMPQNRAFYMCDADCVGFNKNGIDWKLNSRFAYLLSRSGTPFFASIAADALNEEQFGYMKELYSVASKQSDIAFPIDFENNTTPRKWLINGNIEEFTWYDEKGAGAYQSI